jgi:hypothetical protein
MKIKYFVGLWSAALAFDLSDYSTFHLIARKEVTMHAYARAVATYAYGVTDDHNTECYGPGFTPFCDEHMFRDICSQPKNPNFNWTALPTEPLNFIADLKTFWNDILQSTDFDTLTWEDFVKTVDTEDIAMGHMIWRDSVRGSIENGGDRGLGSENRACTGEFMLAKHPFVAAAAALKPFVDMYDNKKCEHPLCKLFDAYLSIYQGTRDAFRKAGRFWFMSETPDLNESAKVAAFVNGSNLDLCNNGFLWEMDPANYEDVQMCTMTYNHLSKPSRELLAALALPSPKTVRYAGPNGQAPTYDVPMTISRIISHLYIMRTWALATEDHEDNEAWDVYDVICENTFFPFCDISQAPTTSPTLNPTDAPTGAPTGAPTAAPIFTCNGTQLLNESSNECFDICSASGATTGRRLADCTDVSGNGVECPTPAPTKPPVTGGVVEFSEATPLQYATALAVAAVAAVASLTV